MAGESHTSGLKNQKPKGYKTSIPERTPFLARPLPVWGDLERNVREGVRCTGLDSNPESLPLSCHLMSVSGTD